MESNEETCARHGRKRGHRRAICHELAMAGFEVIVHGHRHVEQAQAVAQSIREQERHGRICLLRCHELPAGAQQILEQLQAAGLSRLVNSAGIYQDEPMAGMTPEQWGTVIDVSLKGFFQRHPLVVCFPLSAVVGAASSPSRPSAA